MRMEIAKIGPAGLKERILKSFRSQSPSSSLLQSDPADDAAVLEQGIVPLYSTDLHHAASRGLASKGGFVAYAQTLEIWL